MGVPADVERDSRDCLDGECRHFLITRDGRDIGAVRCLPQKDGTLRLQRFCIRKDCRGQGADARPSPLWKTASGRRDSRLWCWTPNVLPGASMRPAGYEAVSRGVSGSRCAPCGNAPGTVTVFPQKRACPPCAGERALFHCYAAGFLPRSRARSRRRPVRTQPSTAPAKAPAVSMSTSRRLPSRPGTES